MSATGAIVRCGRTLPLARTFDSLRRVDEVTLVLASDADRRVAHWLTAMAANRGWTLARTAANTPGAMFNCGLAASAAEWVFLLEGGDVLAGEAVARVAASLDSAERIGFVAGDVRLAAQGVDEIVRAGDPARVETFDPAHPGLRACCWHRQTVTHSGGLDQDLPAAVRYELWLRLLAQGRGGRAAGAVLLTVSVDTGGFVEELNSAGYAHAVADVLGRHQGLLASQLGAVLAARARRVAELGGTHAAGLARQARALAGRGDAQPPPPDPPAHGHGVFPRRVTPRSRQWGYERGGPVDRVYIEQFLDRHAADIHGAVLEVQEADYTRRFGGAAITSSDVVDLSDDNPQATIVSDLRTADNIAADSFDCVIITQTIHVIDDMAAVVAQCWRALRPGGVLLATFPCVSRVCLEYGRDADFWRLTPAGARLLVERVFGEAVAVDVFGNVLASSAFLMGMSPLELATEELAFADEYSPTLVGVRAVKAAEAGGPALRRLRADEGLVLLYHRVAGDGPDPHRIAMPVAAFDAQMAWLARHCATLPLSELVAGARARSLPPRAVSVTFDDGYVDTCRQAQPVLARHGIPATCFVATADLDEGHVFWWDRLAALLLGDGARPGSLDVVLPEGRRVVATATEGERMHAHGLLYHSIAGQPADVRDGVIEQLRSWAGDAAPARDCRRMTAAEIRAAAGEGLSLGAHTVRHLCLPQQPFDVQVTEISASRDALERIAGTPVRAFAYPFGAFDDVSARAVREAGMESAFTCDARRLTWRDDPLRLPRVEIQEPDHRRFASRVERTFGRWR